jgi:hypothetical protein
MSRPKAAQRVAAQHVSATLASLLSPARAEASRRNGAKSKGPKTAAGKARSAQNALKHGLRAEKFVVVGDENPQEFVAFEAAMLDSLAPEDPLQTFLAGRVVRAAWRLERAEQIEAELFAREMEGLFDDGDLGLALIKDGNGARAFDTLLRYRRAAEAEFARALRMLDERKAEATRRASPARHLRAPRDAERGPISPNQPEAREQPEETSDPGVPPEAALDPATPGAATVPAIERAAWGASDGRQHAQTGAPRAHPNRRSNLSAAQSLADSRS